MVPDLVDISLKICSAIGNAAFGIGIATAHEQEGNASSGHLQDNGALVDIVLKSGGWVWMGRLIWITLRCHGSRL